MPSFLLSVTVLGGVLLATTVAWLAVSCRRLRANVERYSRFMEHGPFLAYLKDPEGRYVYENEAVLEHMARVRPGTNTTLGRTDHELFPPQVGTSYVDHDRTVIEQGKPQRFAETSVDADGTTRHWSSMKFPWRDDHGRRCVAGISIEVTDLRQAESELQAIRGRFVQFLDAAPVCAYIKDADGRFLFMNQHLRATYPEVVAGHTVHDMFAADQADDFTRNDEWVRRTGEPVQCEEVALGVDGVLRYWSTFKFPVTDDGGRRGVGGISIEITDRKRADEQVTRSESLLRRLIEVQEHEKRMLCHELHDGLMQYAIAARMLLEAWRHAHPDTDAAAVDDAIRCIDSGITDGRRTMRGIRPEALDDLGLKAAVEEFAASLAGGGLDVVVSVAAEVDGVPPPVQTAAFRIVQEACANARRHSGTDHIRVDLGMDRDALEVRVEDFGNGFDAASPPRTGFGVVGMAERARLCGGSCRVESVPGRGTVVTARLMASPA